MTLLEIFSYIQMMKYSIIILIGIVRKKKRNLKSILKINSDFKKLKK